MCIRCSARWCAAVLDRSGGDRLCVRDSLWAHEGTRSRGAGPHHSSGLFCFAERDADEDIWASSSRISQGILLFSKSVVLSPPPF